MTPQSILINQTETKLITIKPKVILKCMVRPRAFIQNNKILYIATLTSTYAHIDKVTNFSL